MPDLMMIDVPDISAASADRVWSHVLETASREQAKGRKRRAFGISAAATSLAGALGFALVAPTSSFASWTEVPTPIQVHLGDPALASCLTALPAVRQPLVGERRGRFTTVLLTVDGGTSICIVDDDETLATASVPDPDLRRGQAISLLANGGVVDEGGARYVYGRVAREVAGVTVLLEDGVRVTASVANGYYVAWWPAPGAPLTLTAIDESGDVLSTLTPNAG